MDQYSTKERIFIVQTYFAPASMGGWDEILREKFGSKKPSETTVLQIVNKFQTTGSILDEEEDEDDEEDEEAEEEEECSESVQSISDDEEQSDETESDFPNKRKKS